MKQLPEEFKEIKPVSSPEECWMIATSIIPSSETSHLDRYKLKLAKQYLMKNLKVFNTSQLSDILNNSYFKKFDGDFFKHAIKFSIKHQWIFPITFKAWLEKDTENYDRNCYLELINKNNHKEQLKFFCDSKTFDLDSFFRSNEPSYYLSLFAQEKDPKYILYNKAWSKEEIRDWFSKKEETLHWISKNYFPAREIISEKVQNIYIDILSTYLIKEEKKTQDKSWERPFIQALRTMPNQFWIQVEEKSPGLIRQIISLPVQVQEKDKKSYHCNIAQNLMSNLLYNGGIARVLETFEPYLDLGLIPMTETIALSNYEIKSDAFEVALRNNLQHIFVPYTYHLDMLNEQQKEMMVAACFSWLMKDKKFASHNDPELKIWAEKTLLVADTKTVQKYLKLNKNNFVDNSYLEEIEIIIRAKKLEDNLSEKSPIKRMKL